MGGEIRRTKAPRYSHHLCNGYLSRPNGKGTVELVFCSCAVHCTYSFSSSISWGPRRHLMAAISATGNYELVILAIAAGDLWMGVISGRSFGPKNTSNCCIALQGIQLLKKPVVVDLFEGLPAISFILVGCQSDSVDFSALWYLEWVTIPFTVTCVPLWHYDYA